MSDEANETVREERSGRADHVRWLALGFCAVVLVAIRLLIIGRDADVDELFSLWIAEKPIGEMFETLRRDSGPPLYYLILHAIGQIVPLTLFTARLISLAAAVGCLVIAARGERTRGEMLAIGALLAVHPLHVYFGTQARAYALAALSVMIAGYAAERWMRNGERRALLLLSGAILVCAWLHYYGVYLFALPVALALFARDRRRMVDAVVATVALAILFLPGFYLISLQPSDAVAWMKVGSDLERIALVATAFLRLGPDGRQPLDSDAATMLLRSISALLLLVALVASRKAPRSHAWALTVVVAILAALAAAIAGFTGYFPLRFESLFVAPVIVWFTLSVSALPSTLRTATIVIALVVSTLAAAVLVSKQGESRTEYRVAAMAIRRNAPAGVPIFATGPVFFELDAERRDGWRANVDAFPSAIRVHPGHRGTEEQRRADVPRLRNERLFIWAGDGSSEEAAFLRRTFRTRQQARIGDTVVLLVAP